jgi:hypothetical protein
MPQSNKKKKVERDQTQTNKNSPAVQKERKSKRTAYLIISLVIAVVLVLVGIGYYQQYVVPFQRTVITFDDTVIKMRYFLDRAKTSGTNGMSTLQYLTNEMCIKEGAARYDITITPQDIDSELRIQAAGGDNVTITDAEFKEWYRQFLNDSKMSNTRYREIINNALLETRLREYISRDIPSTLEHAHVYIIYVNTYDEAVAAKERIDAGESYYKIAREISLAMVGEELEGEYGWIPKGAKVYNQDPFLWEAGKASQVLAYLDESSSSSTSSSDISFYYLLYTSEVEDREVETGYLSEVQNTVFQQWLVDEMGLHDIHYKYDSEIDKWVSWQLSKDISSSSTTTSG